VDRDLRLRVIFDALDRITSPIRSMANGARTLNRTIATTRQELRGLERAQAQMGAFRGLENRLRGTNAKLEEAKAKTAALRAEIAATESPTRQMTAALARAEREEKKLCERHEAQGRELQELSRKLESTGVDVAELGRHEQRLGEQIAETTRKAQAQERQLARINRVRRGGEMINRAGGSMRNGGMMATLGVTLPVIALGVASSRAAAESRDASAQVMAALASMRGASQRTMAQLQAQSRVLMHGSTRDDDDIMRSVTANLLTFGRVSGRTFDRAQQSIMDVSARLRMELQPATLLVGKALNDPVKGMTAMGRAGIQFTDVQKRQIRQMATHNNLAGAQAIILGELERQFRGSAQAQRDAAPGRDTVDEWRDLSETFGEIVLQDLPPLIRGLTSILRAFNALSPGTQQTIVMLLAIAAVMGPLITLCGFLASGIGLIVSAVAGVAGAFSIGLAPAAAIVLGIVAAVAALAYGAYLVYQNWGAVTAWFRQQWANLDALFGPAVRGLVNTVSNAARRVGAALTAMWNGPVGTVLRAVGRLFVWVGGIIASVCGSTIVGALNGVINVLNGFFDIVGGIITAICSLLSGDFSGAWEAVKGIFRGAVNALIGILQTIAAPFIAIFNGIKALLEGAWNAIAGVFRWAGGLLGGIWNGIKGAAGGFAAFFVAIIAGIIAPIRIAWEGIVAVFNWAKGLLKGIWDAIVGVFSGGGLVGAIRGQLEQLRAQQAGFRSAGQNIARAFADGIRSRQGQVAGAAGNLAGGAVGAARDRLQIRSPSRVFMAIGRYLTAGLALGIDGGAGAPVNRVDRLSRRLTAAMAAGAAVASPVAAAAAGGGAPGFGRGAGAAFVQNLHFTINAPGGDPVAVQAAVREALAEAERQRAAAQLSSYRDDD
jgi:hypothetical protein